MKVRAGYADEVGTRSNATVRSTHVMLDVLCGIAFVVMILGPAVAATYYQMKSDEE
jgi:hypothetical protein